MRLYLMVGVGTVFLVGLAGAGDDLAKLYGLPPANWFRALGKDGYQVGLDRTEKQQGKASAFLKSVPAKSPSQSVGLEQAFLAENHRGKRLRMTAHLRSKEVEGWAGLFMRVDSKDKVGVSFDNMQDRKIKGSSDWKKYESVLDVPEDAESIHFGFLLAGKGQVWADDFKFEVVGKDVKTTQQAVEAAKDTSVLRKKDHPKEPKNLDFEQ